MEATKRLASREARVEITDDRAVRAAYRAYLMETGSFSDLNEFDTSFPVRIDGRHTQVTVVGVFQYYGERVIIVNYDEEGPAVAGFDPIGYAVIEIDEHGVVSPRQVTCINPDGRAFDATQLL